MHDHDCGADRHLQLVADQQRAEVGCDIVDLPCPPVPVTVYGVADQLRRDGRVFPGTPAAIRYARTHLLLSEPSPDGHWRPTAAEGPLRGTLRRGFGAPSRHGEYGLAPR